MAFIGKAAVPVCFKAPRDPCPLPFFSLKSAWMDGVIYEKWFDTVFLPAVLGSTRLPCILIVDNCGAHGKLKDGQVAICPLPPNITSVHQPPDAGIIAALKRLYKGRLSGLVIGAFERSRLGASSRATATPPDPGRAAGATSGAEGAIRHLSRASGAASGAPNGPGAPDGSTVGFGPNAAAVAASRVGSCGSAPNCGASGARSSTGQVSSRGSPSVAAQGGAAVGLDEDLSNLAAVSALGPMGGLRGTVGGGIPFGGTLGAVSAWSALSGAARAAEFRSRSGPTILSSAGSSASRPVEALASANRQWRGAGSATEAVRGPVVSATRSGAELDKVELDISAQYTRIYPYSCRSCVFLMYCVHAPTIIMCLNNSMRSGYIVIRVAILCLSLSDSRNRLCATTTVWGSPCDAAGEKDAIVGYQICDRSWTFANKRRMCLSHLSRMPGPRREGVWVCAA